MHNINTANKSLICILVACVVELAPPSLGTAPQEKNRGIGERKDRESLNTGSYTYLSCYIGA